MCWADRLRISSLLESWCIFHWFVNKFDIYNLPVPCVTILVGVETQEWRLCSQSSGDFETLAFIPENYSYCLDASCYKMRAKTGDKGTRNWAAQRFKDILKKKIFCGMIIFLYIEAYSTCFCLFGCKLFQNLFEDIS